MSGGGYKDLCDDCGRLFVAERRSQRFCSDRCSRRFHSRATKARQEGRPLPKRAVGDCWRQGTIRGVGLSSVQEPPTECWICGRGLEPEEEIDGWYVHSYLHFGGRWDWGFCFVCPDHGSDEGD